MRQYSLTAKQAELLSYLRFHIAETGIAPSFEEMKEAMGLQSRSGIFRLIEALEARGYVRKFPNRARAIEIIEGKARKVTSPVKLATTEALIAELAARGVHVMEAA